MSTVEVGQLWVDNDPRLAQEGRKRYIRVNGIEHGKALCQAWYDEAAAKVRPVRIRLDRFKPVATGYRPATPEEIAREGITKEIPDV